jgi:cell wall-associated NlpC family hydrolase
MPASAALRRLCAIATLTVAGLTGSALALAPAASAAGPAPSASGTFQTRLQGHPGGQPLIARRANEAANIAIAHIGDPYRYGSAGPYSFDCSGLTMWSYDHAHLHLPRTAAGQYAAVRHEIKAHMRRGDLVFFHDSRGHVYHVGMFLYWNAQHRAVIIHAPHSGTRVHRQAVWTSAWYAGTRRR